MAREWLLFVQESAFGVPVTPGVVWPTGSASAFYGRLEGGDSFTMRPRPVMVTVPYGGGVNVPAFTVADKIICKGRYTTKLYAGPFSQFLLNWGGQPVNTAKTFPWTTTEIAGNLASVSIYHVVQRSDGTYKSRAYRGCKVDSMQISSSQDSTLYTLSMEITGAVARATSSMARPIPPWEPPWEQLRPTRPDRRRPRRSTRPPAPTTRSTPTCSCTVQPRQRREPAAAGPRYWATAPVPAP